MLLYFLFFPLSDHSEHSADEIVDELLSVSVVTTLLEGVSLVGEATLGGVQLEVPHEVVGLLEVGADGEEFVDEVLNAVDAKLAEVVRDQLVVDDGDSLLIDSSETSLVNESLDGLLRRITVSDVGLNSSQHVDGGLVQSDQDGIMELSKSQELQDLSDNGSQTVDTSNSDNQSDLSLSGDEKGRLLLGLSDGFDSMSLSVGVDLGVLLGSLGSLSLVGLFGLSSLGVVGISLLVELGVSGDLLLNVLRDSLLAFDIHDEIYVYI